jgi:Skp family chaperone for outer membrane proteins
MGVWPRKILAIGLGLAGVIYLVAPTQGQAPKGDTGVRAAAANGANNGARTTGALQPATPTVVGTVDLDKVFKNYDKVKAAMKDLSSQIQIRKGELMKFDEEARQEADMARKFQPGSPDFRKHEDRITELKAKIEAGREQYQRELEIRQAESMSILYQEVSAYAGWVAKQRGITVVMVASNTRPSGSDPNSVLAAVNRPVIYSDARNDITDDVIHYLNQTYNKMGKQAEKPAGRQQPAARGDGAGDAAGPGAGAGATPRPGFSGQ